MTRSQEYSIASERKKKKKKNLKHIMEIIRTTCAVVALALNIIVMAHMLDLFKFIEDIWNQIASWFI